VKTFKADVGLKQNILNWKVISGVFHPKRNDANAGGECSTGNGIQGMDRSHTTAKMVGT
jgi:hypothetical protein